MAAGSALGHKGSGASKVGASAAPDAAQPVTLDGAAPESPAAANPGAVGRFADTPVFAAIASVVLAIRVGAVWIGSAMAVVVLPIVLGLARLVAIPARPVADWISGRDSAWPDFDEYGNPRQPGGSRRRALGAMLFVGFFGILFLGIVLVWILPAPNNIAAGPTPNGSGNVAVATGPNAQNGQNGNGGPTLDPTPNPSDLDLGDQSLPPGATRRPATPKPPVITAPPMPAPTVAASATTISTPVATTTSTPVATRTSTPSPTVTPTPAPTPTPSAPFLDTTVAPPAPVGTSVTFRIIFVPNATCYLTRTPKPGTPGSPRNSATFKTAVSDGGAWINWGSTAPAGNYFISATCTAPGGTAKTSAAMSFSWVVLPTPTHTPTLAPSVSVSPS
jgi:hypothetical protein